MRQVPIRARGGLAEGPRLLAAALACAVASTGCGALLDLADTPAVDADLGPHHDGSLGDARHGDSSHGPDVPGSSDSAGDASPGDARRGDASSAPDGSRGGDAWAFGDAPLTCAELLSPNGAGCAALDGGVVFASETAETASHPVLLLTTPATYPYAIKLTVANDGSEVGLVVSATNAFTMTEGGVGLNAIVLRAYGGQLGVWDFYTANQGNLSADNTCPGTRPAPDAGTITIVATASIGDGGAVTFRCAAGQGEAMPDLSGDAALQCTTHPAGSYVGFYAFKSSLPETDSIYESLALDDGT
jgi:hypothetical protein